MPYLIIWIRVFLGAHALLSGLNHFFEFFPLPPVDLSPAGAFVSAMTEVGLYDVIKVVEVVVGFCLVFNFFVPLALILEFPITLFTAYAGYYLDMLRVKAPQQTLWSKQIWSEIPERLNR